MNISLNDLFDYVPYKIYQNDEYFKFSLDSVLLAEYVKNITRKNNILELCAGNCAVSMILSTKTNAKITAVEIQKEVYDLGLNSIKYNKLESQINLFNCDIKNTNIYFPGNKFDVIVCNPPYFPVNESSYINDNDVKAVARHEVKIKLEKIIEISAGMLDISGELYLVHRVERLDELIIYCNKYDLNVKNIEFIQTKHEESPKLVIIRAVKNSNFNVKVHTTCIENINSFKNIFL